jgi:hypothetical protein
MPRRSRTKPAADSPPAPRRSRAGRFLTDSGPTRPLASLVFLSPLLAFYVIGLIWVRPDLAATADIWLRELLQLLGVSGALAPTWLAVAVLLLWHLIRRDPWRVPGKLLALMAAETALLTVPLLGIEMLFHALDHGLALPTRHLPQAWLDLVMTAIGAGLYEELLFRLLLVGGPLFLLRHVLRDETAGRRLAVVLVVAALFSGAHHLHDPATFTWNLFLFRAAAGTYLGFLFVYRGFGIAAGVHILFNLVVKLAAATGG